MLNLAPLTPRQDHTVAVSGNKEVRTELHCSVTTCAFRGTIIFQRTPDLK